MLTAKCCSVFFVGQSRVPYKGVIFYCTLKNASFRLIFLRCKYFKNLKRVFISLTPQVKHKKNERPYLPHFCLLLGTLCEGTQYEKAPHKAHTSLCNVDYEFINFHDILNIQYSTIHFPLQKSFFPFGLEWPVLYVTKMTHHVIYVSLFLPPILLQHVSLCRGNSGNAQECNTHPCLQICL